MSELPDRVPVGGGLWSLLEQARAQIAENYQRPWLATKLRQHFYRDILPSFRSLARHARFIRFYQRSGLQTLARATGMLKLLGMEELDALSPRIESKFSFEDLGRVFPAEGEQRGTGGAADRMRGQRRICRTESRHHSRADEERNRSAYSGEARLAAARCSCMRAMLDLAREQARRNIDAMLSPEFDAIVTQRRRMRIDDEGICRTAAATTQPISRGRSNLRPKVKDINEYLAEVGLLVPKRTISARVTYQDPCHLAHAQGIRSAPRQLLRHIGAELVESPRPDSCCGSAGVYNVVQNEISMKVLDEKMGYIASVEPQIIATANVGCMLQFRAGVEREKMSVRVAHVVELLDEAY